MDIGDHTSDARTIENGTDKQSLQGYKPPVGYFRWSHDNFPCHVSGYDILAPSRHHHMNETGELAPSLPETGALAHHMNEIGWLTIIAEKGRFGYIII